MSSSFVIVWDKSNRVRELLVLHLGRYQNIHVILLPNQSIYNCSSLRIFSYLNSLEYLMYYFLRESRVLGVEGGGEIGGGYVVRIVLRAKYSYVGLHTCVIENEVRWRWRWTCVGIKNWNVTRSEVKREIQLIYWILVTERQIECGRGL